MLTKICILIQGPSLNIYAVRSLPNLVDTRGFLRSIRCVDNPGVSEIGFRLAGLENFLRAKNRRKSHFIAHFPAPIANGYERQQAASVTDDPVKYALIGAKMSFPECPEGRGKSPGTIRPPSTTTSAPFCGRTVTACVSSRSVNRKNVQQINVYHTQTFT
jgi:hypothetical protein